MTKRDPLDGEAPNHLVEQAQRQLAAYGEELDVVLEDIRAGKFGAPRDMAALSANLRKALEAVFSERARLEKLVGDSNGGRGGELDLAAAGDEVRRRMARLRAAQSEGGLSGRAE